MDNAEQEPPAERPPRTDPTRPKGVGSKSHDGLLDRFELAVDDRLAAELRRDGYSYAQIADKLGCSVGGAHKKVKRALRQIVQEPAQDVRLMEIARYDKLLVSAQEIVDGLKACPHCNAADSVPKFSTQDRLSAMGTVLRISERRAKLEGLDAPTKVEHRIFDALDAQIEALASELAALESADEGHEARP